MTDKKTRKELQNELKKLKIAFTTRNTVEELEALLPAGKDATVPAGEAPKNDTKDDAKNGKATYFCPSCKTDLKKSQLDKDNLHVCPLCNQGGVEVK